MPDTAAAYRALRADEEDAVLRLWTEVFEIERAYFERYFRGDDRRRLEHTQVAVAPDGRLLAAVHTCLRELRDADGTPRRVGCLANVATRLDARRRGHSGQLLRRAIEGMQAEGCDWSLLFTGTNHHYERYGWRTVPTTHLRGTMVAGPAPGGSAAAYTIRRLELSGAGTDTSQTLADVHAAFNARRPLTALRGLAYWRGFASRWFTQPGAVVLTAQRPDAGPASPIDAYLLADIVPAAAGTGGGEVRLQEIGALPGHEAALEALIDDALDRALAAGATAAAVHLPSDPAVESALARRLADRRPGRDTRVMVRAIAPGYEEARIDHAFARSDGIFWNSDYF